MRAPLPVAASIAQRPGYGGHAWAFLQYLFGARELGFEPILIDRLTAAMTCDQSGRPSAVARARSIEWFETVVEFAGLGDAACLLLDDGETLGLTRAQLVRALGEAPLTLDVMGFLADPELLAASSQLVFVDVDPGFPQLWRQLGQADLFGAHDRHVTLGTNLGRSDCLVPTCGVDWIGILPPVSLCHWQPAAGSPRSFRSVGSWRGPYGPVEHGDRTLGLRVHQLRRFVGLPGRVDAEFALALDVDPADAKDVELLEARGWRLLDPALEAGSLAAYRDFVTASGAEIAVAKGIYVDTKSGWFSDRSACFLASGRPVLCQDTGLAGRLPLDEGIVAFTTLEEAVEGADRILRDWNAHSRAARAIAEEFFDAGKVMGDLLEKLGAR